MGGYSWHTGYFPVIENIFTVWKTTSLPTPIIVGIVPGKSITRWSLKRSRLKFVRKHKTLAMIVGVAITVFLSMYVFTHVVVPAE
jgi:hypothetical protein